MVSLNLQDLVSTGINATKEQFLARIPAYAGIRELGRQIQSRSKLFSKPKNEKNTVDTGEFKSARSKVEVAIGGSWNPITNIMNIFRLLLGKTKGERIVDALDQLSGYSEMYDSFRFENEALTFLSSEITRRVKQKTSFLGRILGWKNKKLEEDPVLQKLLSTAERWLGTVNNVLDGHYRAISKLSDSEIMQLRSALGDLRYGAAAPYVSQLASKFAQTIEKAVTANQRQQAQRIAQQQQRAQQGTSTPRPQPRQQAQNMHNAATPAYS